MPSEGGVPTHHLGHLGGHALSRTTVTQEIGGSSIAMSAGLRITLVDPRCQLLISGDAAVSKFLDAARGALGTPLPLEPNRVTGEGVRCIWLAPRCWLVVAETSISAGWAERISSMVSAIGGMVSEVTDGLAVFELEGAMVRNLLSLGTTLNLRVASFGPGRAAHTIFAGVRATLYPHGSTERFRLHVERSVAGYVRAWLAKATSAFECPTHHGRPESA